MARENLQAWGWRWELPGGGVVLGDGRGRAWPIGSRVSVWPSGLEVSSYSWSGSEPQLGQGAGIVRGAGRRPGERCDLGIPCEDPGLVFFLSTPSLFCDLACSCRRMPTDGRLAGGGLEV